MRYAERLGRASKIASKYIVNYPMDETTLPVPQNDRTGARLLRMREQSAREIETALWQYLAAIDSKQRNIYTAHRSYPAVCPSSNHHHLRNHGTLGNATTASCRCGHAKTQRRKQALCGKVPVYRSYPITVPKLLRLA